MADFESLSLSSSEEEAVKELRSMLSGNVPKDVYQDTYLLYRYLKVQNFNVDEAEDMIRKTLQWKKLTKFENLLTDYEMPEALKLYFAKTRIAFTKKGFAVHYVPVGIMDNKGLIMCAKYADMEKSLVKVVEQDESILRANRKTIDGPYPGFIFIYDMANLSFATATDKKGIETFIKLLRVVQNHYPERIVTMYVINISTYFSLPCSIVMNCFPTSFTKMIKFYTTDEYKDELLELIDADQLPAFLGGTRTDPNGDPLCKTIVCQGGKIDPKYYIQKSKKALSSLPGVKKLVLARASFSELVIEIKEAGSLIEWEFETKTRDIGFGLFYKDIINGEETITELVPLVRIDTEDYSETGMFKCEKAGTHIMLFDNSYSWIRSKEIYYRTKIITPKEHEAELEE